MNLNQSERRVIGSLLEKQLTQPTYYPMTLNALVTACNQKTNRCPVLEMDENQVLSALENLRKRNLVSLVLPGPGGRTNRWRQEIDSVLGWSKQDRAVMAELFLRGPQTLGELRSRSSRMTRFETMETVAEVLKSLAEREPPMVAEIPRGPGQSTTRYAHLLYPEDERTGATREAPQASPGTADHVPAESEGPADNLKKELDGLKAQIAEIQETLRQACQRLDRLEGL